MRTLVSRVVLLLAFAAGAGAQQGAPVVPVALPDPTGPHPVGVRRAVWTDSSRDEPGTSEPDARAVLVRMWYPAASRTPPAPYLPLLEAYRDAGSIGPRTADRLALVSHAGSADAPVAPGRHPVVVFSVGNGEMEFMYTALAQELASHGYLFVLLPHPGVADVALGAGRVLRRYRRLYDPKPDGWEASLPAAMPANLRRAIYDTLYREASAVLTGDVRFVIERLAAEDARPGSPFAGRVDLARVASAGHSYGGNVAVEACRDRRVVACASLDGGAFGPVRDSGLAKPYMLVRPAGDNDGTPRGVAQDHLFGALRAGGVHVEVARAAHRSFMDAYFLTPPPAGVLDAARGHAITSAYLRAFLDAHLRGRPSPLLDHASAAYPEVRLRVLRAVGP